MSTSDESSLDLTGQLLVAMPGMGDPRFEHAVIFICAHSQDGAMGLMINKPARDLRLVDVLDRLEIELSPSEAKMPVHIGGPVQTERGFVLHSDDYRSGLESLHVCDGFSMTATQDILEDIARGEGPDRALFALGYAGWGPDQLEGEIAHNGWLTCPTDLTLVFEQADDEKWQAALASLGVDPLGLSSTAGHA